MPPINPIPLERIQGCLLGQAVGDAVGAPLEGLPADFVFWELGPVAELLRNPGSDTLAYTDDTQMLIGVAETLLAHGGIDEDALMLSFVARYDPERGYGPGARRLLEACAAGGAWRELAPTLFPGGSFGNGAAMRAAPVGLYFGRDLDRVKEQARRSAVVTHQHPLGVEGTVVFALAVALAVTADRFDRQAFYRTLIGHCHQEEFRWQLRAASRLRPGQSLRFLGNSLEAHRSVVTAIACFTTAPDSYLDAIGQALALGDDTDTLAAMAGALSGAHLGIGAIPANLLERLENGPEGRDYLFRLAGRLHEHFHPPLNPG